MTKADIVEQVVTNAGFSKTESTELVECILNIMKNTVASGESGER